MIMHVITNFTASAGAETMLCRLTSGQKERSVVVVSLMEISERNRLLAGGSVTLVSLGAHSLASMLISVWRLAQLIRQHRPDVLCCWMYHAMIAGTIASRLAGAKLPVYWNVRQSLDDMSSLSRSTRTAIRICRYLSSQAAGLVYNSSRALRMHEDCGFSNHNAVVIPNGFELPDGVPDTADAIGRRRNRVGIAARYHPQKDHETFFKAAAAVAETHGDAVFVAAGKGMDVDNPAVMALAVRSGLLGPRVDLKGEVSDMAEFYRNIDLLVLSSRTEGFPNVIAEAMSHGKPVVTTDVGDAAQLVGSAGLVVPPRDADAMAAAIETILDADEDAYRRLSRTARARVEEHYTLAAVRQRYADFLSAPPVPPGRIAAAPIVSSVGEIGP
jgi:glycosyltransferase involved in cell wall biosynthesis